MLNSIDDILGYDKKFKNSSAIKVDAFPLNIREEQKQVILEEANIADEDILIVETEKNKNFIFQPLQNFFKEEEKENKEEEKEEINSQIVSLDDFIK